MKKRNSTTLPSFLKLMISTTLLLVITSPTLVRTQLTACTLDGTEIEKCLTQQEGHISLKPCCTALNQAIQVGFYCLCSLIASSSNGPHLNILLSGSLASGCEITIPPLTLCQVSVSAPTPVFLPTEPDDQLPQLSPFKSSPTDFFVQTPPPPPPPPFTQELYVPSSHSSSCNYMAGGRQPPCLRNGDMSSLNWAYYVPSSAGNKAKTLLSLNWLIFSVVCGELLLV